MGFSSSRVSLAIFLLSFSFLASTSHLLLVHAVRPEMGFGSGVEQAVTAGRSLLTTIDCGAACVARCRLSRRPNLCHRACGTCCSRCSCVPPGTYGNKAVCPCYANMTTHGGRPKCP